MSQEGGGRGIDRKERTKGGFIFNIISKLEGSVVSSKSVCRGDFKGFHALGSLEVGRGQSGWGESCVSLSTL